VRNILIIFYGVIFYAEVITTNEFIGYFIAMIGFVGYNAAKAKYFDHVDICASKCCADSIPESK
jgi:hypothetical protein